jgi:hypothetical protein
MHAIGNAFKYCYHTIGEIFSRPRVILALFFFLLEWLFAAGLALALTTMVLHYFDVSFWGLFMIGVLMAFFMFTIYYLYQLLKARAIVLHYVAVDQSGQLAKLPALAWGALGYTFQHLVPWRKSGDGNARWQNGKHLVLPLMVSFQEPYAAACARLEALKLSRPLRFDPRRVAVRGLTLTFCVLTIMLTIGLGTWLGFAAASGIVVPFIRRVQATGLALLIFLAISWLPLALSAVKNGHYQADLLAVELADQPDYLPDLLAHALGRHA